MLMWELVGAVVGAGLASGREVSSFFTQYGVWSYAGILLAVAMLTFLSDTQIPICWKSRWPEKAWNALLSLLLTATGGAMLSGAGEAAALTLPIRNAYWIGTVGTMLLAWLLARRTVAGLAVVSRVLLAVLAVMIGLGLFLPRQNAVVISQSNGMLALLRGVTYGGFNAALQAPILAKNSQRNIHKRKRALLGSGAIILCLLMLGNAVLLKHPILMRESMPFLRMLSNYGDIGYYLGAACLYLAILSTLTACLRGLNGTLIPVLGIALASMMGFTGVVERIYPVLGGGSFAMMLAAKFMNCSSAPFHSRRDML